MNAMIFAAGLGTRLSPLTNNCPKAMVELDGKPLLEHTINKLKQNGVERIVVNVHHFADKIIYFLENNDFGIDIVISDEKDLLLDTGGGLKKAENLFIPNEPILIHNVDILSDFDISYLINSHIDTNALATLLVRSEIGNRFFLSYENMLTGWRNTSTLEKKIVNDRFYISKSVGFTGIHIVSYNLLSKITEKGVFSIIDVYLRLAKDNLIQTYTDDTSFWMDLGTVEQLDKAKDLF